MDIPPQRVSTAASANKKQKRSGSTKSRQHPPQPQLQRSFSSSEEDLKSTPEYGSDERDSEKGKSAFSLAVGRILLVRRKVVAPMYSF